MLRSQDIFPVLIDTLSFSGEDEKVLDYVMALSTSCILYYLVQEPHNTEYITHKSIQVISAESRVYTDIKYS